MRSKNNGAFAERTTAKGFSLRVIIPTIVICLGVLASGSVGYFALREAETGLRHGAEVQLTLTSQNTARQLQRVVTDTQTDLRAMATGATMKQLVAELPLAVELSGDPEKIRDAYHNTSDNPEERAQVMKGPDNLYGSKHEGIHGDFVAQWQAGGYADMLFFDLDGLVLYSVTKSGDFLLSVEDKVFETTPVPDLYTAALEAAPGQVVSSEFAAYGPAGGVPSQFVATPVYTEGFGSVELSGVVMLRITHSFFNEILGHPLLIGESAQGYLLDDKGLLLSKPVRAPNAPLLQPFGGLDLSIGDKNSGSQTLYTDSKAYQLAPIDLFGQSAVVATEISRAEVNAASSNVLYSILTVAVSVLVLVLGAALAVALYISRPLAHLSSAITRIRAGKLDTRVPGTHRRDEIGDIARNVDAFQDGLRRERQLAADQEADRAQQRETAERLVHLNAAFDNNVTAVIADVNAALRQLESASNQMTSVSEQTASEAQTAAAASDQSLQGLQAVAGATEELTATVQEIDRDLARSNRISEDAGDKALQAQTTINGLETAAGRINEVVSLISDIAEQTNLLALNATIEAARAGEAGKGFAVVASEVKELANQTGKATEEISSQIQAVQSETRAAVGAIHEVIQVIGEMNEVAAAVTSAIEEQAKTTGEISQNIQQVTGGSSEVAQAINKVSDMAVTTGQGVEEVRQAISHLEQRAHRVTELVDGYLKEAKAG